MVLLIFVGTNFRGLSETRSFKDTFEFVENDPINTMSCSIFFHLRKESFRVFDLSFDSKFKIKGN